MSNANSLQLPTRDELEKLSPHACVVYAAMAARVVQPLFGSGKYQPKEDSVEKIDEAIRSAEEFVRNGTRPTIYSLGKLAPTIQGEKNNFAEGYNIIGAAQHALSAANAVSNHEPTINYKVNECYKNAFEAGELSMKAAGVHGNDICMALRNIYNQLLAYSSEDKIDIDAIKLWSDNNPPDWYNQALKNNKLLREYWDEIHKYRTGDKPNIISKSSHDNPPCLNADKIAEALADVLEDSEDAVCFGLFGRWGRGKTYLAKQVAKRLEKKKYATIEYDAWKYRTTPECWAFLYETFAERLRKESWFAALRVALNRNGCWPIIFALFLFFLFYFLPCILRNLHVNTTLSELSDAISLIGGVSVIAWALNRLFCWFRQSFVLTRHDDKLGLQAAIGKDFIALIKTWVKIQKTKRLLLIVDDLDRCESESILEIIESIQIFCREDDLGGRLKVMILVEDRTLKTQLEAKYRSLLPSLDGVDLGDTDSPRLREYRREAKRLVAENVEKIFDAHIRLDKVLDADLWNMFDGMIRVKENESTPTETRRDTKTSAPDTTATGPEDLEAIQQLPTKDDGESKEKTEVTLTEDEKRLLTYIALNDFHFPSGYWTPRAVQHYKMQYQLARTIWQNTQNKKTLTTDMQQQIIIEILNSRNPLTRVELPVRLPEKEKALLTKVVNMVIWDND
ncbi:MAG: P-loop NTPase fold protein [Thermoguttaceae bacterium]